MGRTVKMTIHKGDKLSKAQIKRLNALKDRPIVFDDDAPEYTLEELKEMQAVAAKKRAEEKKELVAIRISHGTLEKAKSIGKGYTSFLARLVENAINDKDMVARSL